MIFGIDGNSKSIAVAWWDGHGYKGKKLDVWDRWSIDAAPWFRKVMDRFWRNVNLGPDDVVYLEEPLVFGAGGRISATIKQSYINGIVQASVGVTGATCLHVHPSTWKKSTTGNGRASKEEVQAFIREHASDHAAFIEGDEDLFDATAIVVHGRTIIEGLAL